MYPADSLLPQVTGVGNVASLSVLFTGIPCPASPIVAWLVAGGVLFLLFSWLDGKGDET